MILAASSEPTDSAPIPPTQENIEQQERQEEQQPTQEGEERGDEDAAEGEEHHSSLIDAQEAEITELIDDDESIIGKPDHESPPRLPDDFYYNAERIHAKPLTTDEETFPENTLSL